MNGLWDLKLNFQVKIRAELLHNKAAPLSKLQSLRMVFPR
jgi:hypothetical protein